MGEAVKPKNATRSHRSAVFAWQGWRLELPARWNPIKLDGDYEQGFVLIADMNRPQLGLRWRTVGEKRFDVDRWAERALRDEVGKLAAEQAKAIDLDAEAWDGARLFIEPQPPGRDVFVARSRVSGRVVEIVHHVRRRDRIFNDVILPAISDSPAEGSRDWAVFDLACSVPAEFHLATHRLNAGDLTLAFEAGRRSLVVRQIALAGLAMGRMPIEKWLANQERTVQKRYKPSGEAEAASTAGLSGVRRVSALRGRFRFLRWLPREITTFVLHDPARNRLLILQGTDEPTIDQVARTVGG